MLARLAQCWTVLGAIYKSVLVRILTLFAGGVSSYDLYTSQFASEADAKNLPKARSMLETLVNWMPWWGWALVFAGIFVIGLLEYVHKTDKARKLAAATPLPATSLAPAKIPAAAPSQTAYGAGNNQIGDMTAGRDLTYAPVYQEHKIYTEPTAAIAHPNLRIGDLFERIQKDVTNDADEHRPWERVGKQVMDCFSIGTLQCWGRINTPNKLYTPNSPSVPIPVEYWRTGKVSFTYCFFDESDEVPHTFVMGASGAYSNKTSLALVPYCDLQVNRAQALAIWPEPSFEPEQARNDLRTGFEHATSDRNPGNRELALTVLADWRGKGVEIRNAVSSAHGNDEEEWLKATVWWTQEVSSAIAKVDRTDSRLFDYLDTVDQPRVPIARLLANPSPAVVLAYNMLDKRLLWLFDLIKKYQGTPV